MSAFIFSGLNSLIKEEDRKRFLALPDVQECFHVAETCLQSNFGIDVRFNELVKLPPQQIYSLDRINLATTLIVSLQVGVSRALLRKNIVPRYLTSVSLGDVARTIISGAVDFNEAIQISNINAEEKAGLDKYGESVALLVDLNDPLTATDYQKFFDLDIGVSQLSPRLLNLAGNYSGMKSLREYSRGRRWRIVHLLNYPFHSNVLAPYASLMTNFLKKLDIKSAHIPMFSSTFLRVIQSQKDILEEQILTITHPHHWMKSVDILVQDFAVKEFINIGPCRTLARAAQETSATIKVIDAIDLI